MYVCVCVVTENGRATSLQGVADGTRCELVHRLFSMCAAPYESYGTTKYSIHYCAASKQRGAVCKQLDLCVSFHGKLFVIELCSLGLIRADLQAHGATLRELVARLFSTCGGTVPHGLGPTHGSQQSLIEALSYGMQPR